MTALSKQYFLSPAEYLAQEREADFKSEYLNGMVVAMAGAKWRHNVIAGHLSRLIGNAFENRPCIVFNSDMKVQIEKANVFRYPDVSALCGPIDFYDGEEDVYCNPQFIGEVLSPSTENYDRNAKFALYRMIDTFGEYLMLSQDKMEAELHRKDDERWSSDTYTDPETQIELESIGLTLRLGDLYEKVQFPAAN
ncbi:MAG: Uma2 family endonuclease [Verrucomicrobiales bacterium]|jgi:Uma2 family endonuclease